MSAFARRAWLSTSIKPEAKYAVVGSSCPRFFSVSTRRLLASQAPINQRSPKAATQDTPTEAVIPQYKQASALDKAMGLFFFTEIARGDWMKLLCLNFKGL
jgi:23S rRNA maturation mini-RNase III